MGTPRHLENILSRLGRDCSPSGERPNQYMAHCPCHEDNTKSLSVGLGDNGAVVMYCQTHGDSSCNLDAILSRLYLKRSDLWPDDDDGARKPTSGTPRRTEANTDTPPPDFNPTVVECSALLRGNATARDVFLKSTSLPETVFQIMPDMGARNDPTFGHCWTFPERDAKGNVIGVGLRLTNGDKRMLPRSQRGMCVPSVWKKIPGPVYFPEGATDTLALSAAGLCAIGRPGNSQKLKLIAQFIEENLPPDREIIWLGENDRKEDGKWPGRDNSLAAMNKVVTMTGRQISFRLPPLEAKDVRQWLTTNVGSQSWAAAGVQLAGLLLPAEEGRVPLILEGNDRMKTNNRVLKELAFDPDLFARAGQIVRVIMTPGRVINRGKDENGSPREAIVFPAAPRIAEAKPVTLGEYITRRVDFRVRKKTKDGKEETIKTHPPEWVMNGIHSRGDYKELRHLEAVIDHPVIRPDGSIVDQPGYDPETRIFYYRDPSQRQPEFNRNPSKNDALAAWSVLEELIAEFPFEKPMHKSAWLAGVLTPIARFAFEGPAPLFLVDGNSAGAGKGLLCDTIAIPLTGRSFATTAYTDDDNEMRKRITSLAMEGDRLVLLDNITGDFGGASIDRALTSSRWKDRILSTNTQMEAPLIATWYGTGNNIELSGDILRRLCHIRLETHEEKPEEKNDFKHPDLRQYAIENRHRLLGAAITILVAYFQAGAPERKPKLKAWGSFEGWSRVVRQAIVWLGLDDPYETKANIRSSAHIKESAIKTIISSWELLSKNGEALSCGQILNTVFPVATKEKPSEVPKGLEEVAAALDILTANHSASALGNRFRMYRTKRYSCSGKTRYLSEDGDNGHKSNMWNVFYSETSSPVSSFKQTSNGTSGTSGGFPNSNGNDNSDKKASSELFQSAPEDPEVPDSEKFHKPKSNYYGLDDPD